MRNAAIFEISRNYKQNKKQNKNRQKFVKYWKNFDKRSLKK